MRSSIPVTALILAASLAILGCGAPRPQRVVQPALGSAVYLIPDWGAENAARDALTAALGSPLIYTGTAPTDTPAAALVPSVSGRRQLGGLDLVFLVLPEGATQLPLDSLRPPTSDLRPPISDLRLPASDLSLPTIAILSGNFPARLIEEIGEVLHPVAYVLLGDHYARIEDLNRTPAFVTGCRDFKLPFTGDFPHLLKIEYRDNAVSIRPMDADGYLIPPDTVTAGTLKNLDTLLRLLECRLIAPEWEAPLKLTHAFVMPNNFADPLTVLIRPMTGPPTAWKVTDLPAAILVMPGSTGTITLELELTPPGKIDPRPEFEYAVTIGDRPAAAGRLPLTIEPVARPTKQ
ncbi:MAG: hypothetical protein ABIF71_06900 [Planctomycetota bacterium]